MPAINITNSSKTEQQPFKSQAEIKKQNIKQVVMVSIMIVLVIIILLIDYLNKRALVLMIQNSSNAAMSSFAKLIIMKLKFMWLPQVMTNIRLIRSLQIDTETIISFLCQFYAQTSSGYRITDYIIRGYQTYNSQMVNNENSAQQQQQQTQDVEPSDQFMM